MILCHGGASAGDTGTLKRKDGLVGKASWKGIIPALERCRISEGKGSCPESMAEAASWLDRVALGS